MNELFLVSLNILEKPLISSRGNKYSPGESLVLLGYWDDRNGLTVPPSSLYCLPYKTCHGEAETGVTMDEKDRCY